jgi:predicted Ser/Thr protein kinase
MADLEDNNDSGFEYNHRVVYLDRGIGNSFKVPGGGGAMAAYCTNCGKQTGGAPFCPHCGVKNVSSEKRAPKDVALPLNCPECGTELKGDPGFCDSCGARLKGEKAKGEPTPGTVVRKDKEKGPDEEGGSGEKPAGADPTPGTVVRKDPVAPAREHDRPTPGTVMLSKSGEPHPGSFGRYRVLREVGRGAMGVVFLARDDKIGRNVAIKALDIDRRLPEDEKEEIRNRFEREARAAGMLSHQNIVTVYDVGEEEGVPYIAMEYLEGANLTETAHESPLSIPQAKSVASQVLAALAYAHAHDVVHRDIKPDNIFLLPDGRVKVADFGIARIASSSTMTQVGQVMGTPGYMSPEQVKGEVVGPASDIFSTGVLLYELLTGTAPFSSTSATSIMYKIVHEEPRPPHLINPGVPPNLEAVITRATAKNPTSRYQSASEMKDDIESGATPEMEAVPSSQDGTMLRARPIEQAMPVSAMAPTPAVAAAPPKKKTALWIGVGAGALLVVAGVAVVLVFLLKGGVSLAIKTPTSGEKVSNPMTVSLSVGDPSKVDRIELYIDGTQTRTLSGTASEAQIDPGGAGEHELRASAYDKGGAVLADVTSKYTSEGGGGTSGGQTGNYKADVVGKINEAAAIDNSLVAYANQINEVYLPQNNIPTSFLDQARALSQRADQLAQSVNSMSPPGDLQDVHAQLVRLCGYLQTRASAIFAGCQSFINQGSGGPYKTEFGRGQPAKVSFRPEWPPFLELCRARGLSV